MGTKGSIAILFLAVLLVAFGLVAGCTSAPPPGRYAHMGMGGNGAMVLDTQTGAIWLCAPGLGTAWKDDKWTLFAAPIPGGPGRPYKEEP
jgi:hypothetical protein